MDKADIHLANGDLNDVKEIYFVEGCFDEFDGTQEELDALIKAIRESFSSGELADNVEVIGEIDLDSSQLGEVIDSELKINTRH